MQKLSASQPAPASINEPPAAHVCGHRQQNSTGHRKTQPDGRLPAAWRYQKLNRQKYLGGLQVPSASRWGGGSFPVLLFDFFFRSFPTRSVCPGSPGGCLSAGAGAAIPHPVLSGSSLSPDHHVRFIASALQCRKQFTFFPG